MPPKISIVFETIQLFKPTIVWNCGFEFFHLDVKHIIYAINLNENIKNEKFY